MILTYKPNIFLSGVFLAVICAIAAQPGGLPTSV